MDESAERTPVQWREWGEAAFEEAEATERPILLSISARWCGWCHRMDRRTYDDPRVAAVVHDGFVPVRVDADRRPRVRERYTAGGFPSTAFLAPDGGVLSAATYLDPDGMRQVLDRVREEWTASGADAGRVPRALRETETPAGEPADVERFIAGQLDAQFDDRHAGWGDDAKFPLPETARFALKRDRSRALATLDAVRTHLLDGFDGGCYRYAANPDWSDPQREKLLGPNAALLRAFADAYLATGADAYREAAARIADYLTATLWTGEAFGGSQAPGDSHGLDPTERADADEPPVDETVFAAGNARAADALLALVAYTDDEAARRYGERTLDYLAAELVDEAGDVTHFAVPGGEAPEGDPAGAADDPAGTAGVAAPPDRCLLADQAAVARAFATATQVLGSEHLSTARAVADAAIDRLQQPGGEFLDAPPAGPGLLDRPLRPVDDNASMADALVDLAVLTGEERYRRAAREAVAAFAGAADRMGVQVAGYGTAAARASSPPLAVVVGTPADSDLHRAALRLADHEKVVVPAAGRDDGLRPVLDLQPGTGALLVDGDLVGRAATPAELADLVADETA